MTKAPYIVYTPDEDFVLTKEDVNNSGGGSGSEDVSILFIDTEAIQSGIKLLKTWNEMKNLIDNKNLIYVNITEEIEGLDSIITEKEVSMAIGYSERTSDNPYEQNTYSISTNGHNFECNNPDDYPVA